MYQIRCEKKHVIFSVVSRLFRKLYEKKNNKLIIKTKKKLLFFCWDNNIVFTNQKFFCHGVSLIIVVDKWNNNNIKNVIALLKATEIVYSSEK